MLLVGTRTGLIDIDEGLDLLDGPVTALAATRGGDHVALVDRTRVVAISGGRATPLGELDSGDGQSLVVLGNGDVVVGRRGAHLSRLRNRSWTPMTAFDEVEGRAGWKNPAGPTPDARTLAVGRDDRLWVNVHVGGVWWSDDGGATWAMAIEPAADVHQVAADDSGRVAVAAAIGLGWSVDDGATWTWTTDGLAGAYSVAVAIGGDSVVLSSSTGPFTSRATVSRGRLGARLERLRGGLPEWFGDNVDSGCVALHGPRVAIGAADGTVYVSEDDGASFDMAAKDLGVATAVALR